MKTVKIITWDRVNGQLSAVVMQVGTLAIKVWRFRSHFGMDDAASARRTMYQCDQPLRFGVDAIRDLCLALHTDQDITIHRTVD